VDDRRQREAARVREAHLGGGERRRGLEVVVRAVGALPERRFDTAELVAEGDAVVARFTLEMRFASWKTISVRGLTYYRLADGRIVEDDPITTPDLAQELGPLLAAAPV
jgi:predicted ester cyclase